MRDCYGFVHITWLIVVFFAIGCKNETKPKTILPDSMLSLEVQIGQGMNIDPLFGDTLDYVGFPGSIGYFDENNFLPFLIIGKEMEPKDDIKCNYIASIRLNFPSESHLFGLAFPVEAKYQTMVADNYDILSTDKASLKLWLHDWFSNAYRERGLLDIAWGNETDLYRALLTNRK